MNLKTFLRYQYDGDLFTRADMLVRKYSIDQYLKNKDYDFALYNKMQKCRSGKQQTKQFIPKYANLCIVFPYLGA